jgi:hypothetical protein
MQQVEKIVFVVFFSGSRARTKITKICEAFGANRYPFPEEPNRLWQMKSEVYSSETLKNKDLEKGAACFSNCEWVFVFFLLSFLMGLETFHCKHSVAPV